MRRNLFWLGAAALVALYLFKGSSGGPKLGAPAPPIEAASFQGEPFNLSDHQGRVVLLDFWATWCPPCQHALPAIQRLHERYAEDDDVLIMTINTEPAPAEPLRAMLTEFMSRRRFTFPVALTDPSQQTLKDYGIQTIPTSVLIGKDGYVEEVYVGLPANHPEAIFAKLDAQIQALKAR